MRRLFAKGLPLLAFATSECSHEAVVTSKELLPGFRLPRTCVNDPARGGGQVIGWPPNCSRAWML
jgi:hypothetical protein